MTATYADRFGNTIRVGDIILLARSQSGSLTLGRVTRIEADRARPHLRQSRVWWRSWGSRYDTVTKKWVPGWAAEREINPHATTPYTGILPPSMAEAQ